MAEWSVRWTRNPAIPGLSFALATCWICSWSYRVQIFGHASPRWLPPASCYVLFGLFVPNYLSEYP